MEASQGDDLMKAPSEAQKLMSFCKGSGSSACEIRGRISDGKQGRTKQKGSDETVPVELLGCRGLHFERAKHLFYLKSCLNRCIPYSYAFLDTTRINVAYFALAGLDLLGAIDELSCDEKTNIINWIYSLQTDSSKEKIMCGGEGFRGSEANGKDHAYDCGHLTLTYCAICSLLMLGDDLSRVNRKAIITSLKSHQLKDGSFQGMVIGSENDMRFVFCAVAVSYLLNDWSGFDIQRACDFILNCLSFEGGFGQLPGLEAHGGSTFCALASLSLMDKLDAVLTPIQKEKLMRWCIFRQQDGFNGRPNKDTDTCYSFWVGSALHILGGFEFIDKEANIKSIIENQDPWKGGLGKYPGSGSDPMHTYLGIGALSLHQAVPGIEPLIPSLNISTKTYQHLKSIHAGW